MRTAAGKQIGSAVPSRLPTAAVSRATPSGLGGSLCGADRPCRALLAASTLLFIVHICKSILLLYCIVCYFSYITLYYIVLSCIILYYTILYYVMLCYVRLHYIVLYMLYCIMFYI